MASSVSNPPWLCAASTSPSLSVRCSSAFVLPHSTIRHNKLRVFTSASFNAFPESKHYLVNKVSGTQLDQLLDSERTKSMVVDFYATWCGPCIILAQELERLAVEFGHAVEFVKIDTDEEYELAQKMEVRGLPTVIFVSKDAKKNAIRTEGILPRETYRSIIQEHLL